VLNGVAVHLSLDGGSDGVVELLCVLLHVPAAAGHLCELGIVRAEVVDEGVRGDAAA
jgi:hypothetical protein